MRPPPSPSKRKKDQSSKSELPPWQLLFLLLLPNLVALPQTFFSSFTVLCSLFTFQLTCCRPQTSSERGAPEAAAYSYSCFNCPLPSFTGLGHAPPFFGLYLPVERAHARNSRAPSAFCRALIRRKFTHRLLETDGSFVRYQKEQQRPLD